MQPRTSAQESVRAGVLRVGAPVAAIGLLMLAALAFMPVATAQGQDDVALEDAPNDMVLVAGSVSQPAPSNLYSHVDLRKAWVGLETEATVQVGVSLATLTTPPEYPIIASSKRLVQLHFEYGDGNKSQRYRVAYPDPVPACSTGTERAALQAFSFLLPNGQALYRTVKCIEAKEDASTSSIVFELRKEDILDRNHAALWFGTALKGFYAQASTEVLRSFSHAQAGAGTPAVLVKDRVPDTGVGPDFVSRFGKVGNGHLTLFSPQPIRASNGESTTLVYRLHIVNEAETDDVVHVTVENKVNEFTIRVPSRVQVPAKSHAEFPLILTMEFTHRHGQTATFTVRVESTSMPAVWASTDLGVHWLTIPQPQGHHPNLWLHSGTASDESRSIWMNAQSQDPSPEADDLPVSATGNDCFRQGGNCAKWVFPLSPELQVGVDFDANATGTFTVDIKNSLATQAHVTTYLRWVCTHADCKSKMKLLAVGQTAPRSVGQDAVTTYETDLEIKPEANLVTYQKGSNLELEVFFITSSAQGGLGASAPEIRPKTALVSLPLVEYHDPVEEVFKGVGALSLNHAGTPEKPVNPGRTVMFPLNLRNNASEPREVVMTLEGHNRDWARFGQFETGEKVKLGPFETKRVEVAVAIPDEAVDGERAELFAVAEDAADPMVVALSRIRAAVVPVEVREIPDEGAEFAKIQQASKESPGTDLGMTMLAVALWTLAMARRRRNQ